MKRVGTWLGGKSHNASTQSLSALDEPQHLADAMRAASEIMNDDVDAAEVGLSKGNSAFHKLGKGVVTFLRATLGFEQEIMREASERLADAESTAAEHQRHAQRSPTAYRSSIYPVGSEFALCHAESQLMSAVVAVLNESLTESIKGFYKLRTAYKTLDGLLQAEDRHRGGASASIASTSRNSLDSQRFTGAVPGGFGNESMSASRTSLPKPPTERATPATLGNGVDDDNDDDDEFEFVDADEGLPSDSVPARYLGHLVTSEPQGPFQKLSLNDEHPGSGILATTKVDYSAQDEEADLSDFSNHPVDEFIHSGSNLCFGILQLMLSLIPPAFSKLLYIIGFKGDRERGIKMLWQATHHNNINGALAGLITLGYYNGMIGFCDILTADAYPKDRCRALLADMRERYPRSHLWLLEEARMHAGDRELEKAVDLTSKSSRSPLKQVEALQWFENSLNCMYLHRYSDCSASFQKCVTLNNWSHALYYYIAGVAHVEEYRLHKASNPKLAQVHAKKAADLLNIVPQHTGKKKFMARQLPFDIFVLRKIRKWEHRAKEWGVEFVDAVGVSPIEEMIYFWNGYKRMRPEHLETSLARLAWSQSSANPLWAREGLDEHAILHVLRAATLRNL
ncbi:Mitochondrial outer membrane protein iml2, partial [Cryomyces antarcticus]